MDLLGMLPALEGWAWRYFRVENVHLGMDEEKVLVEEHLPGWVINATVTVNNPRALLRISYQDPYQMRITAEGSPYMLNLLGTIYYNAHMWCNRYDSTFNIYSVSLNPNPPSPFYASDKHPAKFIVKSPLASTTDVALYLHTLILINDMEVFKDSVRDLLGTRLAERPLIKRVTGL
jgi:hypothetical protein